MGSPALKVSPIDQAILEKRMEEAVRAKRQEKQAAPSALDSFLGAAGQVGEAIAEGGVEHAPDVGSLVGGATGAAIGTATLGPGAGTAAGAITGGAVGGALGEAAQQRIRGEETNLADIAIEGGIGAGGEVVGLGAGRLLAAGRNSRFVRGRMAGRLMRGAAEADRELRRLAVQLEQDLIRFGDRSPAEAKRLAEGSFTTAKITHKRLFDELEAFGRGSLSAGRFQVLDESVDQLLQEAKFAYARGLGPYLDADETGALLAKRIEDVFRSEREAASAIHEAIGKKVGRHPVELATVRDTLSRQASNLDEIGKDAAFDPEGISSIVKKVRALPDGASFEAVKELRSDVGSFISRIPKGEKTRARAAANELYQTLTNRMEGSLRNYDRIHRLKGDQRKFTQWVAANKQFSKAKKKEAIQWVKALVKMADEEQNGRGAIRKVMGFGPKRIRQLGRLVGTESRTWKTLQKFQITDLFEEVGGLKNGKLNAAKLRAHFRSQGGFGTGKLDALFGKELGGRLREFADAAALVQAKSPVGNRIAIHIVETGAILGVIGGAAGAAGSAVGVLPEIATPVGAGGAAFSGLLLVSPRLLNRWLTDPKRVRRLIDGVKPGAKTREVLATISRLMAEAEQGEILVLPGDATDEQIQDARDLMTSGRQR